MKNSTSLNSINADHKISLLKRALWIFINFIGNLFSFKVEEVAQLHFNPSLSEDDWKHVHSQSSPSRALSDLFWLKLDWAALSQELGGIHVLDTGCGHGNYFTKINDFSGKRISSYCGLDVNLRESWDKIEAEFKNVKFKQMNSTSFINEIPPETNFFMTQSAIEHFENDLGYFEQIKRFIDTANRPTLQIHLFPSAACLYKYPWHGIRQYTPGSVSKITQIFKGEGSYSVLLKLGGKNCNLLHFKNITVPSYLPIEKLNNRERPDYFKKMKTAILDDFKLESSPSFYALIIHSNHRQRLY